MYGYDGKILAGQKEMQFNSCAGGDDVEANVFCSTKIKSLQTRNKQRVNFDIHLKNSNFIDGNLFCCRALWWQAFGFYGYFSNKVID